MPWITFERDYNWSPPEVRNAWAIFYRAPGTYHVVRAAAAAAIAAGAARPATDEELSDAKYRRRRAQ